jgi:hypothetical protein
VIDYRLHSTKLIKKGPRKRATQKRPPIKGSQKGVAPFSLAAVGIPPQSPKGVGSHLGPLCLPNTLHVQVFMQPVILYFDLGGWWGVCSGALCALPGGRVFCLWPLFTLWWPFYGPFIAPLWHFCVPLMAPCYRLFVKWSLCSGWAFYLLLICSLKANGPLRCQPPPRAATPGGLPRPRSTQG